MFLSTIKRVNVHTIHHVPKCLSCHKGILVINGRPDCFHDYIYVWPHVIMYMTIDS